MASFTYKPHNAPLIAANFSYILSLRQRMHASLYLPHAVGPLIFGGSNAASNQLKILSEKGLYLVERSSANFFPICSPICLNWSYNFFFFLVIFAKQGGP